MAWRHGAQCTAPDRRTLIVLLGLLPFTPSCERPLSDGECRDLLDHYTEKQIEQARPSTSSRQRVELKRAAQGKAQTDPEFQRCSVSVSRSQFDCAMAAHSADQIERCLL